MGNGVSLAALQSVIKMQSLTGIIAVVMVVGISMLNMAPAVPKTYHWKKSNFKGVLSRYEGCGGADLKQASHVRLSKYTTSRSCSNYMAKAAASLSKSAMRA